MRAMMRSFLAVAVLGIGASAYADESKTTTTMKPDETTTTTMKPDERALQMVFFDFDSATPEDDLLMVANWLECTPNETIVLDAYADPRGTDEYNASLARRRAEAVRDRLVSYGINKDRILLGVFGENGEHANHAHARRVEVRSTPEEVATIVDKRKQEAVAIVRPTGEVEQIARP
jgi:outer membrane protein OmpA-like peptidoglycan-associated protein